MNPYQVTKDFEKALCEYTGAPYAVAVNSGTMAILLALKWEKERIILYYDKTWETEYPDFVMCNGLDRWNPSEDDFILDIPSHTYVSVPCAAIHAGWKLRWVSKNWSGEYQFIPLPVWDSARRFTSLMYRPRQFQCLSFATNKILGIEQGGAILHDNPYADRWFRKMRFDGRTEGIDPREDTFDVIGYHCIMLPSIAAQLILKLHHLPKHNDDMPYYEYPDLSTHPAFKAYSI